MDQFVFKSLHMELKMLLLPHAIAMICQWREGAFSAEFLMILLHQLIHNTILLIVLKNQMQLVYLTNFAMGFFNFLAQQTYNMIRLRVLEEETTKILLFRCAPEMLLTSAAQTLFLALMLIHQELTIEQSNNMKDKILFNQFVQFLLHDPDNCEPWKAYSGGSDLKKHQQSLRAKTDSRARILIAKYALRDKYRKDINQSYQLSERLSRRIINDQTLSSEAQGQTHQNQELLLSIMFRGSGSDKNEDHEAKLNVGRFFSIKKVIHSFLSIDQKSNSVIKDSQVAVIEQFIAELTEKIEAKQSLAASVQKTLKRGEGIGSKGWLSIQKEINFPEDIKGILRCQISEEDNIVMMKCDQISNPKKADQEVQAGCQDSASIKQDQQAQTLISCKCGSVKDICEENDPGNIQSVAFSDLVQQQQNQMPGSPKNQQINQQINQKIKKR